MIFPLPSPRKILGFPRDSTSLAAKSPHCCAILPHPLRMEGTHELARMCMGTRAHTHTRASLIWLWVMPRLLMVLIFHTRKSSWWCCHESGYQPSQGRTMESREDEEQGKMKGSETNPLCPTARTNTTKKHEHLAAVFRCFLFFFFFLLPKARLLDGFFKVR